MSTAVLSKIVDEQRSDKELILTVAVRGVKGRKRSAERRARRTASSLIPFFQQQVNSVEVDRSLGMFQDRYLIEIEHNESMKY